MRVDAGVERAVFEPLPYARTLDRLLSALLVVVLVLGTTQTVVASGERRRHPTLSHLQVARAYDSHLQVGELDLLFTDVVDQVAGTEESRRVVLTTPPGCGVMTDWSAGRSATGIDAVTATFGTDPYTPLGTAVSWRYPSPKAAGEDFSVLVELLERCRQFTVATADPDLTVDAEAQALVVDAERAQVSWRFRLWESTASRSSTPPLEWQQLDVLRFGNTVTWLTPTSARIPDLGPNRLASAFALRLTEVATRP